MVQMPKDQVIVNFGPARYNSQKAIRNEIEDAKREAKEEVLNEIINDPELDLGGGDLESAEVIDYYPSTREGTALLDDGTEIEYINSTPTGLAPGDEIIYLTFDIDGDGEDEYIVIGVTDRAGDITPVELPPAAALSADFPLRTDSGVLAFPINPGVETGLAGDNGPDLNGYNFAYDMIGGLGIGSDVIIGPEAAAYTAVNAFVRENASNVSLFSTSGASTSNWNLFCQANGTLIQMAEAGNTVYFRRPADTSWTSYTATNGNDALTFDFYSEYAWIWSWTNAGLGPSDFLYMSNADTTFVSAGALGLPNSTATATRLLLSGHGYLAAIIVPATGTGEVYLKSAGDTSSFVLACTFPVASFNPTGTNPILINGVTADSSRDTRVDSVGNITYLVSLFGNVHIRYLDTGTGFITDYDTGIPVTYTSGAYTRNSIQGHMHTSSGLVLIPGVATDVELGYANAGFYPALAAYNFVSSTYVYSDEAMGDDMSAATDILSTIPVEVGAGIVRYATRSNTSIDAGLPTNTLRHYELSGL
jgi:hypothetical protein